MHRNAVHPERRGGEATGMALAYSLTLDGAMRSNETLASVSPSASQALMEIHDMLVLVEGQMTCAETAAPPEEDA